MRGSLSFKTHPVTGEQVPDDNARIELTRLINPRKAQWPQADFIVGNPPFIGASTMRRALGDGYVDALRSVWTDVPESADFVMYWWQQAAQIMRGVGPHPCPSPGGRGDHLSLLPPGEGGAERRMRESQLPIKLNRFGFITTNSLKQIFNRRVLEAAMSGDHPVSIIFAIPDHPWVDSADGAAVRIAMTVAQSGEHLGLLQSVTSEQNALDDAAAVAFSMRSGHIHANLRMGADVGGVAQLNANKGISQRGFELGNAGFIVSENEVRQFSQTDANIQSVIRPYRNGRDLSEKPRNAFVIDLHGRDENELRSSFPATYQWLSERVKPERLHNKDHRLQKYWWLHRRSREDLRLALSDKARYIATIETSKHRTFQFLDASIAPDNKLVCVAIDDAYFLGVLSSTLHGTWALATGSTLEDRPVYAKSACFETFPFPEAETDDAQRTLILSLAEQIDAHRKRQQALHPELTLTGMYNVLEKLKSGEALNAKEKILHEHGLVSVLKSLHDELDEAVLNAYGWADLLPLMRIVNGIENTATMASSEAKEQLTETLLERLVALNAQRARQEQNGVVHWLRPEFQNRRAQCIAPSATVDDSDVDRCNLLHPTNETPDASETANDAASETSSNTADLAVSKTHKQLWPTALAEQARAISQLLASSERALSVEHIAAGFKGAKKSTVANLLETLVVMGRAQCNAAGRYQAL